jgi:hypothetical protein
MTGGGAEPGVEIGPGSARHILVAQSYLTERDRSQGWLRHEQFYDKEHQSYRHNRA